MARTMSGSWLASPVAELAVAPAGDDKLVINRSELRQELSNLLDQREAHRADH
ncbi:MAG: hypothetical protein JF922_04595 [Candidatus Dormibacteraeota bacterium]|uniref:Uncharacterized protein n=1 Tax=Candidatus Nephthysia bennettiae TaxID=3127016 RepID=A0A934N894_9BACT|nr:hypothetical protein [Candidatus Dormibacteraeota bacterium]